MPVAPLADCTIGAFQEQNMPRNNFYADPKKFLRRQYTNNPYRRLILEPVPVFDPTLSIADEKKKKYEPNPDAPAFVPTEVPWESYALYEYNESKYISTPEYAGYRAPFYYSLTESSDCHMDASLYKKNEEATDPVNTSSATPEKAVNVSQTTASCGNTGTSVMSTPIRRSSNMYKMYVDGRPKVIRGITSVEVKVEMRLGEETFILADVPQVFGVIVNAEDIVNRYVIVEGDRGEDMGRISSVVCCDAPLPKEDKSGEKPPLRVLRAATTEDMQEFEALDKMEKDALNFCKTTIQSLNMRTPLEVQRAVFQFDRKKLSFTYRSDSYVEFKSLLRALNRQYQCRIWMHQLNWEVNCKPRRQPVEEEPQNHKPAKDSRRRCAPKRDSKRHAEETSA